MNWKTLLAVSALAAALSLSGVAAVHAKEKHDKQAKPIPPGLQKKAARGEPLPPGWQKKIAKGEVLPLDVWHHARPIDNDQYPSGRGGAIVIEIDGRILRVVEATREILDVLR